jgi:branched-chain amino acid transport system substrate-binding protein
MRARPTLAALAVAVLATGCSALPSWNRGPEQVVIGVDLNLTGRDNEFGSVFHGALELEAERLNQRQRAGEGRQLRLAVLDNRGDPAAAAENLATLLADPAVSAIVTAGCPRCVVDLAPDLTVPVISLDAETTVAAPASERRWAFRIAPDAAATADALSAAMAQAGVRSVGVIASDTRYGDEGLAALADAADRDGLTIGVRQRIAAERAGSISTAAERIARWQPAADPLSPIAVLGPDAVVVWAPAPHAADATRALRDNGYTGSLYLDMLAADQLFLGQDPGEATLVFTPTLVVDTLIATSPALSERRRWFADYLSRYGTYHAHSSFAADALLALADAVQRGGTTDRATIRDKLESSRIDGITGQIRFTGDQHSGLHPSSLTILSASNGRWRYSPLEAQ